MERLFSIEEPWYPDGPWNEYDKAYSEFENSFIQIVRRKIYPLLSKTKKLTKGIFKKLSKRILSTKVGDKLFTPFINATKKYIEIVKKFADNISISDFTDLVKLVDSNILENVLAKVIAVCIKIFLSLKPIHELIKMHQKKSVSSNWFVTGCHVYGVTTSKIKDWIGNLLKDIHSPVKKVVRQVMRVIKDVFRSIKLNLPSPKCGGAKEMEEYLPYADAAYNPAKTGATILKPYPLASINNNGRFVGDFGFEGNITWKENSDKEIVLAFRGTDNVINWITDVIQYCIGFSFVYFQAAGLLNELCEDKNARGREITVIGHSLGGGLAQFATACVEKVLPGRSRRIITRLSAIGFNSAGLNKTLYSSLVPFSNNISHLHLKYDVIMMLGNQLGIVKHQNAKVKNPCVAHELDTMRMFISEPMKSTYYRLP